jgi:hypothetical protein
MQKKVISSDSKICPDPLTDRASLSSLKARPKLVEVYPKFSQKIAGAQSDSKKNLQEMGEVHYTLKKTLMETSRPQ